MFKLSKESKLTFYTLILVPCLWIVLNSYGRTRWVEDLDLGSKDDLESVWSLSRGSVASRGV